MADAKRVCILGTSLSASSRSQLLAAHASLLLAERGVPCDDIDLRTESGKAGMKDAVAGATHLIFAVPIYNFNVNAVAKEAVETLDALLEGKVVGLLCAAGGQRSYMAALSFANSLMLDFRCWIVPRFVYAVGSDFEGDDLKEEIARRVEQLVEDLLSK